MKSLNQFLNEGFIDNVNKRFNNYKNLVKLKKKAKEWYKKMNEPFHGAIEDYSCPQSQQENYIGFCMNRSIDKDYTKPETRTGKFFYIEDIKEFLSEEGLYAISKEIFPKTKDYESVLAVAWDDYSKSYQAFAKYDNNGTIFFEPEDEIYNKNKKEILSYINQTV